MTKPALTENGNGLKAAREAKGLTALQLADLMKVRETTIFRWQSGTHTPTLKDMRALARILSCTVDELFPDPEEATA